MHIYNTLTKAKQEFIPLTPDKVSMYVCGVTVYDECHLGHARAYVCFDVIRRYLEYKGFKVEYIQNFTDIDDKIINRAREIHEKNPDKSLKECVQDLTQEQIELFFAVMDALGIKRADKYPCATDHIDEMIEIVQCLVEKGHAYEIDGDVYFEVASFKEYGKLSGENLEDLQSGQRVKVDERKKSPLDFALWKKAKPNEPSWDSPWGQGRPGWHIECSAMSRKYLGDTFDIHGGGCDLIFPHHENEIAQTECYTGKPFAKYWMHNGFLTIDKEKMSKSLGNFFTLKDLLCRYKPETIRFFLMSSHYKGPVDFSEERLQEAESQLNRGYLMLKNIDLKFMVDDIDEADIGIEDFDDITALKEKFIAGMDDDFNTSAAVASLFELVNIANSILMQKKVDEQDIKKLVSVKQMFKKLAAVLNIFSYPRQIISVDSETDSHIKELLVKREQARKNKDWEIADKVRDEILAMDKSIEIEDTRRGTFVSGDPYIF